MNRFIGSVDLADMRYALKAEVEDVAIVPGVAEPRWWTGKVPDFDSFGELLYYYRTTEPTDVDIRFVATGIGRYSFWYVAAWNDYTGWGCQDGVSVRWADDLPTLARLGWEAADRQRWGVPT